MKQFARYTFGIRSLALTFLCLLAWTRPASSQGVTWQALPFPVDTDWHGPIGQPSTITSNQVVLQGQPVRSLQTYSGPLTLSCTASLSNDVTSQGGFWLSLIPLGQALNSNLTSGILFSISYGNSYGNQIQLYSYLPGGQSTELWSNSFPIAVGANYQLNMGVAANGVLSLNVNGQSYPLPNSTTLPFSQFQIQMQGWSPPETWTASNFAVVPEPATAVLVAVSLAGFATLLRRRKQITNS